MRRVGVGASVKKNEAEVKFEKELKELKKENKQLKAKLAEYEQQVEHSK